MPTLPLHPALVHVPLGLAFVVPLVAVALAVSLWRGRSTRQSLAVLVLLQALLVGGGFAAMQTGEHDEDRVERIVPDAAVEAHEQRAELFVWAAAAVLAVTVASLVVPAGALAPTAALAAAGALAVAFLALRTGQAGGAIVYTHGGALAYRGAPPPVAGAGPPPTGEHHDDGDHDDD
jgi:uncharacterized membrane protein